MTILFMMKKYRYIINEFVKRKRNYCGSILIFTTVNAIFVPMVDYNIEFTRNLYKDAMISAEHSSNEARFRENFFLDTSSCSKGSTTNR